MSSTSAQPHGSLTRIHTLNNVCNDFSEKGLTWVGIEGRDTSLDILDVTLWASIQSRRLGFRVPLIPPLLVIYLAQYTIHDNNTLSYMDVALKTWHKYKDSFIQTAIRFLGTTDNYNTEMFEHLHIDFAKKGWWASNKRDEFPQMTRWLSRQENINSFDRELSWVLEQQSLLKKTSDPLPLSKPRILLPKVPTSPNKSISSIQTSHRVPCFSQHLKAYLEMLKPNSTRADVLYASSQPLPFHQLDIFHMFKFSRDILEEGGLEQKDVVKASPIGGGRFDTVVVLTADTAESVGLAGTRIGRVKVIFQLPTRLKLIGTHKTPAPLYWPTAPLAYIEWYTAPTLTVHRH
ncbi:hypothetical protein BT96DRAFT_949643 [Gymnopus androsaceus JB14]|uniref:Uncharacterized protein n=1 Tax=Gymnopus androsaceus JB14 TaxID=1447944 RepID=A0A6A4GJC3_9AGAR|nr:hypothetical protein BT96DRAFT_949643 [Gymnopus androsaceus JB14]